MSTISNRQQRMYLDRAYDSKSIENKKINLDYAPNIPYKRRVQVRNNTEHKRNSPSKNKRWVVLERANSIS